MKETADIQVIGTRKNAATRKALRFFSDRGVKVHLVDLNERALKPRELENISRAIDARELIDPESVTYKRGGYGYIEFDPAEELLEKPLLMRMPVVRRGKHVVVGELPKEWQALLGG